VAKVYTFDSFAILALLGDEGGSAQVVEILQKAQEGQVRVLMTWVNVGEVAYIVERRWGKDRVAQVLGTLEATTIEIVPIGRALTLAAAHIKAEHPLAYADAFAAALAEQERATLVTGDPEFETLQDRLSIQWITSGA
jgi:predicted nucleic acid-binding protein